MWTGAPRQRTLARSLGPALPRWQTRPSPPPPPPHLAPPHWTTKRAVWTATTVPPRPGAAATSSHRRCVRTRSSCSAIVVLCLRYTMTSSIPPLRPSWLPLSRTATAHHSHPVVSLHTISHRCHKRTSISHLRGNISHLRSTIHKNKVRHDRTRLGWRQRTSCPVPCLLLAARIVLLRRCAQSPPTISRFRMSSHTRTRTRTSAST
mmetsp:Transcript_12715/g.32409  ORF Transcript_12715/g.32409 Transcript_12715/m.32409 type:complete len:206 (-) Transcript_12715:2936-3553(-)